MAQQKSAPAVPAPMTSASLWQYNASMLYRRSIMKWVLLVLGLFFGLICLGDTTMRSIGFGMAAAGFVVAFALLDGVDRLARRIDPASPPTQRPEVKP